MADTVMVGRLGDYAVAAVGLTGQPRMVFMSVFFALNVAVTAIISRLKGQGDQKAARSCLRQVLMLESALIVVMSTLAVTLAPLMMSLAGAKEDTIGPSTEYFRILGYGLVFQVMSGTICAAQRSIGNTKITMKVNLTANIVNVFFNYLLIGGNFGFPRLEVAGAAIATVMGTAVGLVMAVVSIAQKDAFLHISRKDKWRFEKPMLKSIVRLTGGGMLEQVAFRVGFFAYARVVADLGTDAFAAHQIAMQLMNLSFTFADGIGTASTSLVGQNLGRKRPDLSIMYGKIGQRMALVVAVTLGVIVFATRFLFPRMFTDVPSTIEATSVLITILAFILPVQTSQLGMAGSLRGAGDTRFVAMTMMITVVLVRPLMSLLMIYVLGLGLNGAWVAIIVDQSLRLILLFTRFSRGKWIKIKI
jgi:putative MATE family efflux protein